MLELVGNPVAVNPDRPLKKLALERGWEIRSFKDPAPLFQMPGAKEIGIGAGLLAGVIALITAGTLLSKFYAPNKHEASALETAQALTENTGRYLNSTARAIRRTIINQHTISANILRKAREGIA